MVQLYPDGASIPARVAAIVHLVASSVAGAVGERCDAGRSAGQPPERARGELRRGHQRAAIPEHAQARGELPAAHRRPARAHRGAPGACGATVTADMDFTVTEETHENYDPQKTACAASRPARSSTGRGRRRGHSRRAQQPAARHRRRARDPGGGDGREIPRRRRADRAEHRTDLERAEKHAQLRGGPQARLRQAAGRGGEASERRCGAG